MAFSFVLNASTLSLVDAFAKHHLLTLLLHIYRLITTERENMNKRRMYCNQQEIYTTIKS